MKRFLKIVGLGFLGLILILYLIEGIIWLFDDDSISRPDSTTIPTSTVIAPPTPAPSAPTLTVIATQTPAPAAGLLAAPNIYNHYTREAPDNETIQFKGFPWWAESGREGSETILLHIHAVSNGNVVCVFPDTVENTIQMARFSTTMPRPFVTFEGVVSEWVGSDLWIDSCRVLAIEKR